MAGESASSFEPYEETALALPEALTSLEGYGESLSTLAFNYLDFEKGLFVRTVQIRAYQEGDEYITFLMTDGIKTAVPLSEEVTIPIPEEMRELSTLPVLAGGAVFFDGENEGCAAYHKITYQTKLTEGVSV